MTRKQKLETIRLLKLFSVGKGITHKRCGICGNLAKYDLNGFFIVNRYANKWKHFSGMFGFPVPMTKGHIDVSHQYFHTENLWINKYGKLRKDLCLHIAKQLQKELRKGKL